MTYFVIIVALFAVMVTEELAGDRMLLGGAGHGMPEHALRVQPPQAALDRWSLHQTRRQLR